jgi:uncharacterized hydrophobic protein (TIGR00271 family)
MVLLLFNNLTGKNKSDAVERLISASTPSQDFFLMVVLSILTATFGLLLNNVAVIIGSMLIAPILYPILSLSLGIIMSDTKLISRSFYTLLKSAVFGVSASAIATLLFSNHLIELTPEILLRSQASLPHIMIAIVAGLAGSFALVKPQLNDTLPGIAISVALIPPLGVIGIGLAKLNFALISGAFLLFLVNAVGIIFASMLTFSMMNFYAKRDKADETIKKEDAKVERQKQKVEEEKMRE